MCLSHKPQCHLISHFLFLPQLHLPLNSPLPGSELTKEPFRWDQRLFALVLRLPGVSVPDSEQLGSVPTDESAITQMCEVTGGTSISLTILHFSANQLQNLNLRIFKPRSDEKIQVKILIKSTINFNL